jgi:hypothetical protein
LKIGDGVLSYLNLPIKAISIFSFLLFLGCSGLVTGDLGKTRSYSHVWYNQGLSDSCATFHIVCRTNAPSHDENLATAISGWTLGIIPTYAYETVKSEAIVYHNKQLVHDYHFKSGIHKFYGIPWILILPFLPVDSLRRLNSDEGNGLQVLWGIQWRTISKAMDNSGIKDSFGLTSCSLEKIPNATQK